MTNFTKQETLKELATIFLFEADHISVGASSETAEAFIGFKCLGQTYYEEPSEKVNLERFNISGSFERGYDYAFQPSILNSLGEHEVLDLTAFMEGTPSAASDGTTHKFMTPDGLCQSVADTVHARWKLEWDPVGVGSHKFTPRELALLANMTEGAVRNAIGDKSEFGIRPIPGSKPQIFSHDEAHRWLSARRGFIAGPTSVKNDELLLESLKKAPTASAFGKLLERISHIAIAASELKSLDFETWCSGTFQFDRQQAIELAKALQIDVPTFVGKALEVSMRRDNN